MKKVLFLLSFAFLFLISQTAEAKGVVVYHTGPKFSTLEELPADAKIDGKHVNFGVAYKQFGLFWLPVWNYGDVEFALITDDEESAWTIDEEQLTYLKEEYNIDIPDSPSIPFWQKIGLKPVIILIVLYFVWPKKKKEEEEEEEIASDEE